MKGKARVGLLGSVAFELGWSGYRRVCYIPCSVLARKTPRLCLMQALLCDLGGVT